MSRRQKLRNRRRTLPAALVTAGAAPEARTVRWARFDAAQIPRAPAARTTPWGAPGEVLAPFSAELSRGGALAALRATLHVGTVAAGLAFLATWM